MSRGYDWPGGWAERVRRTAAAARTPALAGAVLAVAAATEAVVAAVQAPDSGASLILDLLAVAALALCTTVPLAVLGPLAAALAISAASVLSLAVFQALTVGGVVAQLIVLYRLGRQGAGRQLVAPGLAAPFLVLALTGPAPEGAEQRVLIVLLASLAPAAACAGIASRARREALVHRDAREVVARRLVEHTARGERARIARELHDVVAHHISMIAVQAEAARLTTPGMPPAGVQRLSEIGDTARAGLTEMRRLLGVLRSDARAEVADRRPQPGLEQLNELLDEARDTAGAGVRLIVSGAPVTLDPGVELAAYRIIQEALTNARRHAPGAAVDVELRYARDALRLRVRDNGPGPGEALAAGHGLAGMRERAAAAGGELGIGRAAGGGFQIQATLPAAATPGQPPPVAPAPATPAPAAPAAATTAPATTVEAG